MVLSDLECLEKKVSALEEDNAILKKLLNDTEWVQPSGHDTEGWPYYCVLCGNDKPEGHSLNCPGVIAGIWGGDPGAK